MSELNLAFAPQLPLWLIIAIAVITGLLVALGLVRAMRGAWVRAIAWGLLVLALFNPSLLQEEREPLKSVVAVIVDKSSSQDLADRDAQTETTREAVLERLAGLDEFEVREVVADDLVSASTDVSTALFRSLKSALQDVPGDRVAGAVMITDGQVHDIPDDLATLGIDAPLHALVTGRESERDRRLVITSVPRFGVVGESHEIIYRVEETGLNTGSVDVTISLDGEEFTVERVVPGEENSFIFDIPHGGKNIVELLVEPADGELTEINNRGFATINGIRENLRVLLVSGEPHAGERTWRNLLKADASVDLVHFTILRPPEKQDGTPISQLSLIAFPTRELFIEKIDEFDLIIFDRYKRRGVLPLLYFDNIARYVENGGAILVASGPEYAEERSIGFTPLEQVLPATASGNVVENPYRPRISETGNRHPVTRNLPGNASGEDEQPDWSQWFRSIGANTVSGETIMEDEAGNPLLILNRAGEGRVALLLSDHVWLWARGFQGGGPHQPLLRRTAHWLMQEPELDEERLTAVAEGGDIIITRQTLAEETSPVELTTPGGDTVTLELEAAGDGLWSSRTRADAIGLYEAVSDDLKALVQVGPANPLEYSEVISTTAKLAPIISDMGGSITRIGDGNIPRIIPVRENANAVGNGWIGLNNTNSSLLVGINRIPLFSGLLGLGFLLIAFAGMWLREGR